jgi:hypothetical protein
MSPEEREKILLEIWAADKSRRYVPRAYSPGGTGWGVWDVLMGKFVDDKLAAIDPLEPLLKT